MNHLNDFEKYNESLIIEDILLTEGFKDIKSKILKYLKRGILTTSILLALLGNVKGVEKQEILDLVKQENLELYQDVVDNGSKYQSIEFDDPRYRFKVEYSLKCEFNEDNTIGGIRIYNNASSYNFKTEKQYYEFLDYLTEVKAYFEKWKIKAKENNIQNIKTELPIDFPFYSWRDNATYFVVKDGHVEIQIYCDVLEEHYIYFSDVLFLEKFINEFSKNKIEELKQLHIDYNNKINNIFN